MFKMPAIFSDNMVLQRRKPVLVCGEADEGTKVTVSLREEVHGTEETGENIRLAAGTACPKGDEEAAAYWEVSLSPMEAGGPYTMTVECGNVKKVFHNVLVGEVWLAGGQSNMELELQNSDNGKEVIKNTRDDLLRYYYTPKISYLCDELYDAEADNCWMKCEPETTAAWSAVAYYWAVKIRKELNVPVGIVGCNWGGTYAHNWVSRESLLSHAETRHFVEEYEEMVAHQDFDEYLKELEDYREYYKEWVKRVDACYRENPLIEWNDVLAVCGENRWPGPSGPRFEYRPCGLYESMVLRIAPYTLGGVLYYQGENDENNNAIYDVLLNNLIEEWRRLWRDKELPFGIVQLPVHNPDTEPTGNGWGRIRRAQDEVCRTVKNTSLTVITDCGNRKNIHPTDKKTVGERLAENILKDIFGCSGYEGNGPKLTGYEVNERHITVNPEDDNEKTYGVLLHFSGVENGFFRKSTDSEGAWHKGEELLPVKDISEGESGLYKVLSSGFEIAVEDGVYHPAEAAIEGNDIFVYASEQAEGKKMPKGVRYGNENYFRPALLDAKGRPIIPFWIDKL